MRGRTTPRLRTALVGAAASVALVAGVGFVATTPDVSTDDVQLVQAEGAALVQGQEVNIDLKKLVEAQIGEEIPEGTTLKLNGLPEGLKQDGWNITGTPTESGLYNVRVEVASGGQTSTQEVQLMVAAPDGEDPNAPTTGTEQSAEDAEDAEDGATDEESGEAETTGETDESAESEEAGGAMKRGEAQSRNAESGNEEESTTTQATPSAEADEKTDTDTDSESDATEEPGTSVDESSTTSTPSAESESESGAETDDSQESSSPEFPTEEEAFGEGGTDSETEEGTEIDLDEASGSLTDGMLGGSGSLEGSTGGDEGPETCESGDLTEGLEKFLPVVVGEQDDSGMITSIITSVIGTLLPTVLNTASSGNGSVCDAGGAAGSLLESAAGFTDAQQAEGADAQEAGAQAAAAQAAGAPTGGGTTTLDSLLGGDGTQLIELMQLAGGIMEQVGSPAEGTR